MNAIHQPANPAEKVASDHEGWHEIALPVVAFAAVAVILYGISLQSYVLFHSLIEVFNLVVAYGIFVIAWYSRRFIGPRYLWLLGVSFSFVGSISLLHMLAYKGMGVFPTATANLPTQLWIVSRYLEAVAFLVAVSAPRRCYPVAGTIAVLAVITVLLVASIFIGPIFPDCYIEGSGLTLFKKASEYVIMAIFAAALVQIIHKRGQFEQRRFRLIVAATAFNILTDLLFTFYTNVYGLPNFLGHLAQLVSTLLIFKAIIQTGLVKPQALVFWSLERERRELSETLKLQTVKLLDTAAELEQESSELKATRNVLTALRFQHQAILNAAGEGILGLDTNGNIVFANPAAAGMIGGEAVTLIGRNAQEFLGDAIGQFPTGGTMARSTAARSTAARSTAHGIPTQWVELPFHRLDGASFLAEICASPLNEEQENEGSVILFRDITARKALERETARYAERLRTALLETIRTMTATVEVRDPYTAGHQQRVALLAQALAQELGLPPHQTEGIYFGGLIHDIGKAGIPVEILNHPGRLNDVELAIVREHPVLGYDIVKGIAFPWPIQAMILQHHERLDGSGYPNHLSGDQICLEARVLAVADVAEAMISHRPNRPAHSTGTMLAELSDGRGQRYDARIVEACITLFQDKGFTFPHPARRSG